jgi:hypothetical protein
MMSMLDLLGKETRLTFGKTTAQEYHAPCPVRKAASGAGSAIRVVMRFTLCVTPRA